MKKHILFIAGGIWQRPFVEYLKFREYFVTIVNPVVTDTTELADFHLKCDIKDLDVINSYLKDNPVFFIATDQSDVSTTIVSELSEKWGLPSNSIESVDRMSNKLSIYSFAKSIGVNVPYTRVVNSVDDLVNFWEDFGFPFIIKPTDSTMSRGFAKINSLSDISEDIISNAIRFSKSNIIIAQEFLDGPMVTLEGISSGFKHKTIAHSIKGEYFKPGITCEVKYPSNIKESLMEKIISENDRYVESAGINFGLTHSEFIIVGDDFYLIEIGARGGGAGITDKIVPWVSGINVYDVYHRSLLGEKIDLDNLNVTQKPALLKYFQKSDIVDFTSDKEFKIRNIPGVKMFHYNFIGKQYVCDDYDTRHSMAIFTGDTVEEICEIEKEVKRLLQSQ